MDIILKRDQSINQALVLDILSSPHENITLLSKDYHRVLVPLVSLLGSSRLLRSVVAESNFHSACHGPLYLSCDVTGVVLNYVADIFSKGETIIPENNVEEVKQIFCILGVEVDWSNLRIEANENIKLEIVFEMLPDENQVNDSTINGNDETDIIVNNCGVTSGKKSDETFGNLQVNSSYEENYRLSKRHSCNICSYATRYSSDLKRHMRRHTGEKPYVCNTCDYSAATKAQVRRHRYTHTCEKPTKCNICDYATKDSYNLKRHMRRHTGGKPHVCNICDYSAATKAEVLRHKYTHTGEKPIKCNICDHATRDRSDLKRHMMRHTGEKPHVCNICDYSAATKTEVLKHKYTHTGEKPIKCNICDYATSDRSTMKRHMMRHTGEKPYVCNVCDYSGVTKAAVLRHTIKRHGQ